MSLQVMPLRSCIGILIDESVDFCCCFVWGDFSGRACLQSNLQPAHVVFANMSSDSELSSEDLDHDYSSSETESQVHWSEGCKNKDGFEQLGLEPYQFEPEYSSSSEDETQTDNEQRGGG